MILSIPLAIALSILSLASSASSFLPTPSFVTTTTTTTTTTTPASSCGRRQQHQHHPLEHSQPQRRQQQQQQHHHEDGVAGTKLLMARVPSGGGGGGGGGRNNPRFNARTIQENRPVMNDDITAQELRVVTPSPKGKDVALGIMSREAALSKARELGGLDLILINNKSDPPVCKIVDYSKYRYMQEKKAKELKKNSKATEVKEVKMSYKIDIHDYEVRIKNAQKFLKQGNRVKCTVLFRGREIQHDKLGFELLEKVVVDLDDTALREGKPKREGRNLMLILTPRPEVLKAVNENRRKEEKIKKQKRAEAFAKRLAEMEAAGEDTTNVVQEDDEEDDDDDVPSLDDLLDDDYDEDDDDDELSLDDLLGKDTVADELFST